MMAREIDMELNSLSSRMLIFLSASPIMMNSRSTADLTARLLRYSSKETLLITSSIEWQAPRTSCKYADKSCAIKQLFCSINLTGNHLVPDRSLHHQVHVGSENFPKRLTRVKIDMEALGDFQRAKLNKKVNIAFSRPKVLSQC
jgi:hypothetical protein